MLATTITFLTATMGLPFAVKGFVAALVGGIGSVSGAMVGGVILCSSNDNGCLFRPNYREGITFVVLIIVLRCGHAAFLARSEDRHEPRAGVRGDRTAAQGLALAGVPLAAGWGGVLPPSAASRPLRDGVRRSSFSLYRDRDQPGYRAWILGRWSVA